MLGNTVFIKFHKQIQNIGERIIQNNIVLCADQIVKKSGVAAADNKIVGSPVFGISRKRTCGIAGSNDNLSLIHI